MNSRVAWPSLRENRKSTKEEEEAMRNKTRPEALQKAPLPPEMTPKLMAKPIYKELSNSRLGGWWGGGGGKID